VSLSIFQESFRKMVAVARRLVAGEAAFMEFYYACAETRRDMRGAGLDQKISALVTEWWSLAERCRNEFGECSTPLSEQQVREHVSRELAKIDDDYSRT
jgi:hypothetical protein